MPGLEKEVSESRIPAGLHDDFEWPTDSRTQWAPRGTAADQDGTMYTAYIKKDKVFFRRINPVALTDENDNIVDVISLIYSRSGSLIGFAKQGTIYFGPPANGWGGVDTGGVGEITSPYEGGGFIPDFSDYETPTGCD
jgi:hypothetical protein